MRTTRAKDRTGAIALWAFVAFLLVSYAAAAFGPPPPNVQTIAWAGIAGGLVTGLWGYWVDRHREVVR
jgi:membrane associated rhomboid family serine protease